MRDTDAYSFGLHFSGERLNDHCMDAKDFSISLIGLTEALDAVAKGVCGPGQETNLQIKANLKPGSVLADLVFSLAGSSSSLFPELVKTGRAIFDFLRLLLELRKTFGSQPVTEEQVEKAATDSGIAISDNTFIGCNMIMGMHNSGAIAPATKNFASPLAKDVESISFVDPNDPNVKTSLARQDYRRLVDQKVDQTSTREQFASNMKVRLNGVRFFDGKPWEIEADGSSYRATMEDQDFMKQTDVQFSKNTRLWVDLDRIITVKDGKSRISYVITKVHGISKEEDFDTF